MNEKMTIGNIYSIVDVIIEKVLPVIQRLIYIAIASLAFLLYENNTIFFMDLYWLFYFYFFSFYTICLV